MANWAPEARRNPVRENPSLVCDGLFVYPREKDVYMAEVKKTKQRWDSIDPARWMTKNFTRTTEGFLTGRAIVTSVGVFTYKNKDGTTSRELRLPEEVFGRDSLETLLLKPVCMGHPKEKVTPENVAKYQIGSLGNNPSSTVQNRNYDGYTPVDQLTDGFHLAIDMTINEGGAIEDVLNGSRALSMGYECDLELAEPGSVWCGMEYDGIQRNIRYNHCAIVDAARAGDAAKINLDSADFGVAEELLGVRLDSVDAVLINNKGAGPKPQEGKVMANLKKINLDGVEYEGEEKLIQSYIDQKKRADNADSALAASKEDHRKALSALEADRDASKDRADKAEKELKELREKADDPKRFDAAISAKLSLLGAATKAGVECKDEMSDQDIKKAVILSVNPAAKLDGKDEVYVDARFDAALEQLEEQTDSEARPIISDSVNGPSRTDSMQSWQKMVNDLKAQSRGQTKSA
jgi:hypothetical protein